MDGGGWCWVAGSRPKLRRLEPWAPRFEREGGGSVKPLKTGERLKYLRYPTLGDQSGRGRDPESGREDLMPRVRKTDVLGGSKARFCYRKTVAIEEAGIGMNKREF